jgi:M6 family metalloprotease-like protein
LRLNCQILSLQDLEPLFNGKSSNSLQSLYLANSFGKLTIESVLTDWITVNSTESKAAAGQSGLACCSLQEAIAEALRLAELKGIGFKQFDADNDGEIDMFTVLHSGYGAEWGGADYNQRIWYAERGDHARRLYGHAHSPCPGLSLRMRSSLPFS